MGKNPCGKKEVEKKILCGKKEMEKNPFQKERNGKETFVERQKWKKNFLERNKERNLSTFKVKRRLMVPLVLAF